MKSPMSVARKALLTVMLGVMLHAPPALAGQENGCLAKALEVDKPGMHNCYQVSSVLFRSAQPTQQGLANMEASGIKTVVNLRMFHSDGDIAQGTGLDLVSIPMAPWDPDPADIIQFLKLTQSTEKTPILLHCRHGSDRTGFMIACYRAAVCGWTRERALDEMKNGGFGFHPIWWSLEKSFQRLDFDAIRRQAGIH